MVSRTFEVEGQNIYTIPQDIDSIKIIRANIPGQKVYKGQQIYLELNDLLEIERNGNVETVKLCSEPDDDCFVYRGIILS